MQATAIAVFPKGSVVGEAVASQSGDSVLLQVQFTHLPPGKHGFHIHKAGDLRGKGCQGACEHWNKGPSTTHGDGPHSKGARHTGDLGNIEANEKGIFQKVYRLRDVHVHELYGRTLIVHEDEDDLGKGPFEDSPTTGHSGKRIACAIFGRGCMPKAPT